MRPGIGEVNVRFSDQVVLVAGGTGALGRAVALAFLAEGARVAVTSRRPEEIETVAAEAGEARGRLLGLAGDVADPAVAVRLAADLVAAEGRIDALVNAVGGWAGGKRLWETEPDTVHRMLAMNLLAGYALARAVVPHMIRRGRGTIVEVGSKAAFGASPGDAAYAASKAGAVALFASLAEEVKEHGVNVNSVLPSVIDTEANRRAMPGADFSRWPKPAEIARVILFLCSGEAGAVQGACVPVYGRS